MTHMETYRDGIACHRELAKVKAELVQAREMENDYYQNAISNYVAASKIAGDLTRQRNAALLTLDRVRRVAAQWEQIDSSFVSLNAVVVDIRAALTPEPTE